MGPFHATLNEHLLDKFRTSKVQALLTYLLIQEVEQPAQGVGREQTMTLLWPELPKKSAQENLRQTLYQLRRAIPEVAGTEGGQVPFILSNRKVVQINPEAHYYLDVAAFTSLVEQGEPEQLETAVSLYRGEFLADVYLADSNEFETWAADWRNRLRRLVLNSLDHLAAHYLDRGEPSQAEKYAYRMVEIDNLRESGYRHLMEALGQMGKQSEAIRHYERCRSLLQEELGVTPSAETETVLATIKQRSRTEKWHRELPNPETPIFGREKEVTEVLKLLEGDARLVSIVGPGGIGKTRLAQEVAQRLVSDPDDHHLKNNQLFNRVTFVNLVPISTPTNLIPAIAQVLDIESDKGDQEGYKRRLLDYLEDKNSLLLVDNFEHLLEGATLVKEILQAAPAVKILATSRERLNLQSEHVYPLSGLGFSHWTTPVEASRDHAVQLFLHHARRIRPAFRLRSDHLGPLQEIMRLTEGMPLALIMAAGWVKVLTVHEIASELDRSLGFLEAQDRDVPHRQRSMRVVFDATWQRLDKQEKNLFAGLSVFRGGFTRDAAQKITGASAGDLIRLVDRSLVTRDQSGRFEVHELLRQFAGERLRESNEENIVHDNYANYYLKQLAGHLTNLKGQYQLETLDIIEGEFENIRAAWRRASDRSLWNAIAKASESLYLYALCRSQHISGIELFENTFRQLRLQNTGNEKLASAYVTAALQSLLMHAGLREEALAYHQNLEEIVKSVTDPTALAFSQMMLGSLEYNTGNPSHSTSWLEAAYTYYEKVHDIFYSSNTLRLLGWATYRIGKSQEAIDSMRHGLALARKGKDHYLTAALLRQLGGLIWMVEGPTTEVEGYYREAARLRYEMGELVDYAWGLAELANIPIWREGDKSKALPLLKEALTIAEDQNVPHVLAHVKAEFAGYRLIEGKYDDVLALTEEVLSLALPKGNTWTWSTFQQGIAFLALGKAEDAIRCFQVALPIMIQDDWTGMLRSYLPYLGIIMSQRNENDWAAELIACGLTHPHAPGRAEADPLIKRYRDKLEAALGEERFSAAWERGKKLDTLETAAKILKKLESPG